ncbi:MAG: CHAT domain-containing protein, partial [Cyanobacteriota bacterium]|nr:CHAT domain-containing protein [Cyanobacteriota bacterium]
MLLQNNTLEKIAQIVENFSPEQQQEVLNYVEFLQSKSVFEQSKLSWDEFIQRTYGSCAAALQSFQQAYTIYHEISDSIGIIKASFGIGYTYLGLEDTEKAVTIFEKLLEIVQENNYSELEKLAQLSLQLAQNPKKAKAEQLLQQGIQQFKISQLREALQSWQEALEIYREIGDRKREADALANLIQAYFYLGQFDIGARGRTPATVVNVPSPEQLAKQTANLRQLHDLLIQPIADLLPTDPSEKVVFMPQGELYLVPFPALIDEQNQYLIEKHTILTSPSIQLLNIARKSHTEKRNNPASEVLIVGNPTMPELWHPDTDEVRQLSALKGAEEEAFAIAEKFQVDPLVRNEATETIITQKMQNARLIHLATEVSRKSL